MFVCTLPSFTFLRISNLVPYMLANIVSDNSYFFKHSDVSFSMSGVVLRVYRTKTIQFNQRALEIPLPLIPNSVLCPVSALQTLLSNVPAPLSAPLFIVQSGNCFKPILAHHFNRFLKSCAHATGFSAHQLSSRSFRQGGATFAFNCRAPTEFIKAHGDWQSDA